MSLSRLQLAAALLEYDNNDDDPYRPPRSHRDSALFKPYQPRPLDDVSILQNHPPHHVHHAHQRIHTSSSQRRLNQPSSPNRPGTLYDPGSERQSRYDVPEQDTAEPAPNVDLDRWNLPEHLLSPDTSEPRTGRPLPVPAEPDYQADRRSRQLPPLRTSTAPIQPQPISSPLADRISSVHLDVLDGIPVREEAGGSSQGYDAYDQAQEAIARARRVQSMYDTTSTSRTPTMVPLPPSPASTLTSFRPLSATGNEMMQARSEGRTFDEGRPASMMSRSSFDALRAGGREGSVRPGTSMSRDSYDALRSSVGGRPKSAFEMNPEEQEEILSPNPFALPAPPAEMGSRFDPKVLDVQRKSIDLTRPMSHVSLAVSSPDHVAYDPASLQFPSTLTEEHLAAHLTGRPPAEPEFNPLAGRELNTFAEIPTAQEYGKPLRPPKYGPLPPTDRRSLLRPRTIILPTPLSNAPEPISPPKNIPDGYTLGDKPLPPGSRSSILTTTDVRARPGLPLSLSQKTFRSSLIVGGRREDESFWVGGATEDGEVGVEYVGDPDEVGPVDRRPGKLYGKSLMDQLEARKTAMKAKQRVFTGDSRPAMMARAGQSDRPQSMLAPPGHRSTLLHIDEPDSPGVDGPSAEGETLARPTDRMTKSQSVFGVDKIWEREMAKLKIIQEREAKIAAEKAAKEELETKRKEAKEAKKRSKKKKPVESPVMEATEGDSLLAGQEPADGISPIARMSDLPPQLSYSPEKAVRPVTEPEPDAEELADDQSVSYGSPDGEPVQSESDSDSEEDVPLSRFARAKTASLRNALVDSDSDSDEDVPLSKLRSPVKTAPTTSASLPATGFGTGSLGLDVQPRTDDNNDDDDDEEEDDIPLALRRSGPANVEDDLPLGYKHTEAVQRQQAESWRASMASPQMSMAGGMAGPPMGPSWGYPDPQSNAMMSPYSSVYGMPSMGMGYMSPAMTGMSGMGPMGGMGWPGQMMPGMPMPGMTLTMPGMPMMGADGGPMPPQATKNIDDWRKEVAIQPVPTGNSSTRG